MTIEDLNKLTAEEMQFSLYKCCSCTEWAKQLTQQRPYKSLDDLLVKAELIWSKVSSEDCLEAFSHHPRIGGNLQALKDKFQNTKTWASQEQSGVTQASDATLVALSKGNEDYEEKYGFVFLICATGKSADEMLSSLRTRLTNSPAQEFANARTEQRKITEIRLKKLLGENT